jgi:hypothetical protein
MTAGSSGIFVRPLLLEGAGAVDVTERQKILFRSERLYGLL